MSSSKEQELAMQPGVKNVATQTNNSIFQFLSAGPLDFDILDLVELITPADSRPKLVRLADRVDETTKIITQVYAYQTLHTYKLEPAVRPSPPPIVPTEVPLRKRPLTLHSFFPSSKKQHMDNTK